jgi:hypothetical protein
MLNFFMGWLLGIGTAAIATTRWLRSPEVHNGPPRSADELREYADAVKRLHQRFHPFWDDDSQTREER